MADVFDRTLARTERRADSRRWWVVAGDGLVHHYYEAPNRRSALARFRADLIDGFRSGDFTKTDAVCKVRALSLEVLRGPLMTDEAFVDELGWTWAQAICDNEHADERSPLAPVSREEAVRWLGEARAARWEASVSGRYYQEERQ